MTNEPSQLNVVAVIAALNPDPDLVETVMALQRQVQGIVVVDDGSSPASRSVFEQLEAAGAIVLFQVQNSGIAAALNAGIYDAAARWNPEYFLTLDQDSVVCDKYVDYAIATHQEAQKEGIPVGFVTAESYSGHNVPPLFNQGRFVHGFDPMQSGFLVPLTTFSAIGYFDESFFIDGVDSEFTMRSRSAGLSVLIGQGCSIEHSLGQRSTAQFFGRPLRVLGRTISYNYHSPARVYYICRNGTVLTKRYLGKSPKWVLRRLLEESKAHTLRLTFSPGKWKLLLACTKGFQDAFAGRMGRIPSTLEKRLR